MRNGIQNRKNRSQFSPGSRNEMTIPGNEATGIHYKPYYGNLSEYEQKRTIGIRGYGKDLKGTHAGKGPVMSPRTDERIMEMVCDELMDDPYLDASDIEINVKNHEVIMTGTVHDRESKRRAEDLIEGIRDVTNVENKLRIKK